MRIVVITGSPHKNGTSALLADKFIEGATEAGNEVFRFNTAFENVHPCIGCDTCACGKKPCVFKDGMTELYAALLKADMVVFVTPLYYHAMSAQIKMAIDRFHGIDHLLRGANKKAMLIVSAASAEKRIMNGVIGSYQETTHYLGWQDTGILLAYGCYSRSDMEKTDYPEKAYQLGRSVK
ncbi:MAG: flavodoxin family protein [Faecalispora jeddahensis]